MQDSFNETPTEASGSDELPAHLQHVSPDTPVMMYCTGGIRCDIYSAYLRQKVSLGLLACVCVLSTPASPEIPMGIACITIVCYAEYASASNIPGFFLL